MTANLWTLEGHPATGMKWSLAQKVKAVKDAGFDAVTAPPTPELAALLRQHRLRYLGFFSSSDLQEIPGRMAEQCEAGAEVVNVQLGDDFTPAAETLALALAVRQESRRCGIYTAIEVHRDTATETPEKTYQLADAYERATGEFLPVTWDHSHFAVVKHLKPHLYTEVLLQRSELIETARLMHLRPFNGQHAQVPVMDLQGQVTVEFRQWLQFADTLLARWLAGPRPGDELWVCPEIGPVGVHGYNLSVFPKSWDQAVRCAEVLRRRWTRLIAETSRT
ncbi:hypothetical protein [Synoicihabitans lomoniglobus]|uniref:Xylose isomerase n=1 Tax=Synoicihabitans lomoniglobus TaxID=2909285 RepID=A0AAE9ZVQ7_9BACT|nr:hypothetical protein [Opitutaceae bacterium LMO-M01]WED65056.1 hypothetical protein PXH66_22125 [Opitutaceae bacterium LMO-M01]